MPTPNEAAAIRLLAKEVAQRTAEVAARIHLGTKVGQTAAEFQAGVRALQAAEAAAQLELCAAAEAAGVPLAEATATYGSTALVPAGGAASGGLVIRGVTAIGQVVGGGAVAGTTVVLVGTALLAWLLSNLAGKMAADKPIVPGSQTHEGGANVAPFDAKPNSQVDNYYIYAVNTSGWSFYIGRPSDVENRAGKSIEDGGPGDQPIEYKKLVDKPFNSASEATDYLKARVTPGKQSVWTGQWLKFDGGEEYRTVHVRL